MPQRSVLTPLGHLTVSEEEGSVVSLDWGRGRDQADTPVLQQACATLHASFEGAAPRFDLLPLAPAGTAFQRRVWALLSSIPYGMTLTYGELATRLGSAPRPIGMACGRNPIPILIPCHRVLGEGGRLGGYSGGDGPETKWMLLRLEGAALL